MTVGMVAQDLTGIHDPGHQTGVPFGIPANTEKSGPGPVFRKKG